MSFMDVDKNPRQLRKVVFLDIDGVLNSDRYFKECERNYIAEKHIDQSRVALLQELILKTGAEIVLSSSWRSHWNRENKKFDWLAKELSEAFEKFGIEIQDITPTVNYSEISDTSKRAQEISAWIELHRDGLAAFVILDDISMGWGALDKYVVKTSAQIGRGLEPCHIERATGILNDENT